MEAPVVVLRSMKKTSESMSVPKVLDPVEENTRVPEAEEALCTCRDPLAVSQAGAVNESVLDPVAVDL